MTFAEKLHDAAFLLVKAPISGTILTPDIKELYGSHIKNGTELCKLGNLSRMHVVIPVKEVDAGLVDIDDPVEVRVKAFPKHAITGQVMSIGVKTDSLDLTNTIPVHIEIENSDGKLRTGMRGKSRITAHRESFNAFLLRQFLRTIRMDLWF